jgi:hypothetical protein
MKDIIKHPKTAFLLLTVFIVIGIIGAVCWHSIEEIHYLKSFFPESFTVQEAFYASGIELIKIIIISLPLVLIIFTCLRLLGIFRSENIKGGQGTIQ